MSQYLPTVAWSTIASNVSLGLTTYRYYITVNPLDPNEAGASTMSMAINDWFIDFAGYPFLIEEVNGSVLTVYDILERGDGIISAYAPYANKLGYVYRPLNGAIILTQAQLRKLDASAADIIQPIEKGIQWVYRGIRLVSVDDDYSNITRLDLTNNFKYTYTENEGWQGGHKAELDLNIGFGTGAVNNIAYTDNGDGTITIQSDTFMLYDNALGIGYPKPYLVSEGTFSFTDNAYNYVVVDYNSGTPIMYVISDITLINETTIIPVFSVLRRGTILCLTNWDTLGNAKLDKLHQSIVKTQRYRRQSGLAISVPSTETPRRVSITGGTVWIGAVPIDLSPTISGDTGVYMFEYYKSSGVWIYTLASQINNTYYQGTTDRIELTSNRYAVAFIFRGVEHYNNHIYLVYGTGDYTLSQAQASGQPSDLPIAITSHTILIGRIIIQKGSDTITETASAFDKAFLIQPVSEHSGLSSLGWSVSGHTGTTGSVPVFNSSGVAVEASLTNGYVPYKTTNGLENSSIYTNGANVAIGATSTLTKLHLSGDGNNQYGLLYLSSTSLGGRGTMARRGYYEYDSSDGGGSFYEAWGMRYDGVAGQWVRMYTSADKYLPYIKLNTSSQIEFGGTVSNLTTDTNPTLSPKVTIDVSTGRLGVKTTSPTYDFDLNGTARIGTLDGLIKGTSGVLSVASGGTDYEYPLTFQYSVERNTNTINLVGDSSAPGNSKYYGTNSSGTRGYYDLPSSGGTPGGSDTYVQFNDGGTTLGGDSGFTYNKTTHKITGSGEIEGAYIKTNTTTKSVKIGIEAAAWEDLTTGRNNICFGYRSGYSLTTGYSNLLVGYRSGFFITDSDLNTYLGFNSGYNAVGNRNIFLGAWAGYYETGDDKLFIDNQTRISESISRTRSLIYGEFNSTVNLQKIYLNASTYTKRVVKAYQALTSATTVTMNVRDGQNARITLGHNVALTLSNLEDGDEGNIVVTQDATGSRTLTISPTPKVINGGGGTITLTGTANSIDMLSYTYANSVLYITYGKNYT